MATLSELLAQKDGIDREIARLRTEARSGAIAQIRALMAEHGLTAADLLEAQHPPKPRGGQAGKKVAPKYRDPVSGATWTGRGLKPKWLKSAVEAGKPLVDFAV